MSLPQQQRGRSVGRSNSATYSIFTQASSIASTSSLTNSSAFDPSPPTARRSDARARSRSLQSPLALQAPPALLDHEEFPPLATEDKDSSRCAHDDDSPYATASEMRKAVRAQSAAAAAKAKTLADLADARHHREFYADQAARLAVLASEDSFDEIMGDREEEVATRRALKKASLDDGQSFSNTSSSGPLYSSPARRSRTSNKRNQVSSPSAHYAPNLAADDLAEYLEPGGTADLDVQRSLLRAQTVTRPFSLSSATVGGPTRFVQGTPHPQGQQNPGRSIPAGESLLSRAASSGLSRDDTVAPPSVDSLDNSSYRDFEIDDDEASLGHDATGTSPLLSDKSDSSVGKSKIGAMAKATSFGAGGHSLAPLHGTPRERMDGRAGSPPMTSRSSLRTSSFAPVIVPSPLLANTVDVDPDFFEGAALPGSGPGPHFITVSFIKNGKDKIKDQLLSALAATLTILSQNVPGVLIHCITKGTKLAPLDTTSASHFPTTGVGACNFMYVQNKWSLQPGTRNKIKLPAAKIGKDGRPLFDENRGYDGPDRITAVLWITCDVNAKEAIDELQMELEGEHLQIRWKPAQKKNTKNQIVIYGIPPVFDAAGVLGELLHGLKESEKELCTPGSTLSLEECNHRRDLELPLFNGFFKQAIPPKAVSIAEGKETSLNNNKEFTQNGCRVFNLEYDPVDNARMAPVWTQFKESGRSELVLGRRSKVFVVPSAGRLAPAKVNEIRRYMHFHLRYTTRTRTHSHPTLIGLDKLTEITMENPSTRPPRKFTSMRHEYMDLRTPDNLEVFHAVFPRGASLERESSVDCLFLVSNDAAREISLKIQKCPSAWWWHVFRKVRGYSDSTARSLLRNFEIEAEQLADQSVFDISTMTVTTQFANTDDFLDRAEAELGSDDEGSMDGASHPAASFEITDGAKASLAAALLKKDTNLAANSHASAKSRRSTFSCSTGNDTNRSLNTAKYAVNHKSRALELASERKKSAELEATQRAMAQRIRELEAGFASSPPTPAPAFKPPRPSVRISEPSRRSPRLARDGDVGEVVDVDGIESSSDESDDDEWNRDVRNDGNSAVGTNNSGTASQRPPRTSSTYTGANAARSLGGLG
jgi:hypothetical protein